MKCLFITLFNSSIVRPIAKFTLMAISISAIDVRPAPAVLFLCARKRNTEGVKNKKINVFLIFPPNNLYLFSRAPRIFL